MTAEAFDLAEQLQTPIIMLTDLDLGMNDNLSDPFEWDDEREYKRGKVFNTEQLESMSEKFGRYLDVDGDGITYRTYPGTHPTKGSFFTRGTSRDEYAVYTEDGEEYVKNMDRLLRKLETAKAYVPKPEMVPAKQKSDIGLIHFGTSMAATLEAADMLKDEGIKVDTCRIRAFPFHRDIETFIKKHEQVFVIEQNRDAQMRSLLVNECEIDPKSLTKVLCYDGMPITARFIADEVRKGLKTTNNVTPIGKQVNK